MADMLDYIRWRGDLPFTVSPPNEVDAVIFSTLSYIPFRGRAAFHPEEAIPFSEAVEEFFSYPEPPDYVRAQRDLDLLKAAGESVRFGNTRITEYRPKFIKEQDTQFAGVTFLLDDGSLFVTFRGTDNTLVGWKEDLSMSFRSVIPSQALAKQYLQDVLMTHSGPVRVSGHSKGGNVAVYAVSQSAPVIRDRVLEVYNQEGPGFSAEFLEDPGYQSILPKIRTYLPQGSMIGVVLYRAEPVIIVQSHETGIMQHDPFSWDICGTAITRMDALNANSRFFRLTMENWLAGFDMDDRVRLVNMLYDLLTSGDVEVMDDVLQPKSLINYVARLRGSELIRKYLASDLNSLLKAARRARLQMMKGQLPSSFTKNSTDNY